LARVFIIANENEQVSKLSSELAHRGFSCLGAPYSEKTIEQIALQHPDLVLVDMVQSAIGSELWYLPQRIKDVIASEAKQPLPVIALIPREILDNLDSSLSMDDFIIKPWELCEVILRIKRLLRQTNNTEIIKCGDLVIDLVKCQVSLSNKIVALTFKEYQLLKFLASNQGKVFTRETLLSKVWGWDYYGGDRTVDVHIRRLRSKIEDRNHSFIETVRNIGYRFKESV